MMMIYLSLISIIRGRVINIINNYNENYLWSLFCRVKLLFHGNTQLIIVTKPLFKSFADKFTFWTRENQELLSTNNIGFKINPSEKLLIYTGKKNDPAKNPWGFPTSTLFHDSTSHLKQLSVFYGLKNLW